MENGTEIKSKLRNFNKPAYTVLLLIGIYFLIQKNISQAVIFWGLALVFDPFNIEVPFPKRPAHQQLWLLVHLSITFSLIVLAIIGK